jgi:hypothetical protein
MNPRHFQIIVSCLLLFVVVAACSLSPASPTTASTAAPAGATSAPAATNPPVSASSGGGCSNAYFPVSVGTNWAYSSSGSTLGAYTYTWTVADVSNTGFTTNNQYSTGVSTSIKWNCQNGNLAALDAGSTSLSVTNSSSTFKMTSNSITADGYNIPNTFDTGTTWSEKVTVNGTVQSGTKSANSQIVSDVSCSAAGSESVTVPAGTFDTVKATCNQTLGVSFLMQGTPVPAGAPDTVSITDWYAKGVGLVKSVRASSLSSTETIVLTGYKVQ